MDENQPSERVVEQRVRNRIIEYFELAASYDDQLRQQAKRALRVFERRGKLPEEREIAG